MKYLHEPYKLIGFSDAPFTILNEETGERRKLSIRDFVLLKEYNNYEECEYVSRSAIQIAITSRCNYRCLHCMASDECETENTAAGVELSLEMVDGILKEAGECHIKQVLLTGGEPLLHPDFIPIVQSITAHKLTLTNVLTNGALITGELLEQIKELGQNPVFAISFDGIGTHDRMRNMTGAEEDALRAFGLVREHGLKTTANINVNAMTAPRIKETCRMLIKDMGVSGLHLIYTSPVPRWESQCGTEYIFSPEDYFDCMIELIRTSRSENWDIPLDIFLMPSLHNEKDADLRCLEAPETIKVSDRIMNFCPKVGEVVFVGHDGRVLPCSAYEGITNVMGLMQGENHNLRFHSLKEILTDSSYLDPFRVTFEDLQENSTKCRECKWLRLCRGGCRIYAMHHCDSEDCHSRPSEANCIFFRGGYAEKYLELLKSQM